MAAPATAHESVVGAELYPVVGSGPATFTSGWAHFHPRADEGGGCEDALQIDLRMKLRVTRVTAQEFVTQSVTMEWKAGTGGNFAGYALYTAGKNYAGGPTSALGDPAVQQGHHSRTYPISQTVQWGKYSKAFWLENFSFEGESFGASVPAMPVAERSSPSLPLPTPKPAGEERPNSAFPDICRSHSIVFHIVRTNPGGGDGGCLVTDGFTPHAAVAARTDDTFGAVPTTKC
ncbi:MAG TPA: hypothetical protein VMZ00_14505 [Sporichthya sp.]|nr:hypothetical protein [Sporichthya sp.]